MASLGQCIVFLFSISGPAVQHPGSGQLNLDGTWTVDWPMVEEQAARPMMIPASPGFDDGKGNVLVGNTEPIPDDTVLFARTLLAMRAKGGMVENPNPENACPKE